MQVYEDGGARCFSCNKSFSKKAVDAQEWYEPEPYKNKKESMASVEEINGYMVEGLPSRKISKEVCEFFGVKTSVKSDGSPEAHYYPYGESEVTGYKIRSLPKTFSYSGEKGTLFGQRLFSGGKRLVITEGEIDALSVAQAYLSRYGKIYPVVSLPFGAGTKELLANRDWIRGFEEVVLMLDNDEPGQKCTEEAIKIVGLDKVKLAKLPCKDANDALKDPLLGVEAVNSAIWNAKRHTPAGIVSRDELWKALQEYNTILAVPYPECMEGVNTKLKGHRPGEIVLFISGTGSGKSTLLREDILHLLKVTKDKIGIISLEENPEETARNLSAMVLNRNPAEEDITLEEIKVGFDQVFGDDRVIILDHQGSIKDDSIIDKLEYMCLMGCKYLFIDHITILVSEGADGLSGNEAIDKIMNDLLRLVKSHGVWIGLVSHLRKSGGGGKSFEEGKLPSIDDIRGSGSIKQISFDIIAFARNMIADDLDTRNTILMRILKARKTGNTGNVPGALYNPKTGRLSKLEEMSLEQFDL
jgi:twinkle protein